MSTTKITNRIVLEYCLNKFIENGAPDGYIEKMEKMIDQLDKKNAAPKKLTAQQEKNEDVKADILDFLSENEGKGYTVSDLLKAVPTCEGDSNQHVSALMRALVLAGSVEKYTEKRRTYFRLATEG